MSKVLCFGELLLRLPPANGGEWLRTNQLPVFVGGAELNVATALATWQQPVKYCTALPDNIITRDIISFLQAKNIDTTPIILSGERIGLYYLKEGADMKSEENVFDRKYSSFSTLNTGVVNWDEILKDVEWFHFSAIAPAVSEKAAALCLEAVKAASQRNITISIDLNFRSLLWKYGKKPWEIMPGLVKYCDVIMGNIWAANTLLGVLVDEALIQQRTQEVFLKHASYTAQQIFERFPNCKWVANTFRFDAEAGDISYYAALNTKEQQAVSPVFTTDAVADKVGSGDCFMAGLIYGLKSKHALQDVIGFAAAAAFAKLHEKGDSTQNTIEHIQQVKAKFQTKQQSFIS
jgi:2-dehydro-3-deoxygluconokinase